MRKEERGAEKRRSWRWVKGVGGSREGVRMRCCEIDGSGEGSKKMGVGGGWGGGAGMLGHEETQG